MQEAGGTKHTGVPVKTLKKLLKKAGLKVSGKKATLTRRAKKARLLGGGGVADVLRNNNVLIPQGKSEADIRKQTEHAKQQLDAATAKQKEFETSEFQTAKLRKEQDASDAYWIAKNKAEGYKPPKTEFQRQVGNLFGATPGGKKKKSRRA